MSDIRTTGEYVLVNNSSTNEVIICKPIQGRVETNHLVEAAYDYSTFDPILMPPLPATGEPCVINELYTDGTYNWKCVQTHARTTDAPANIPALFVRYYVQGSPYVQPTGAHDDYNLNDVVEWEGLYYKSLLDSNVWTPTSYPTGWELTQWKS